MSCLISVIIIIIIYESLRISRLHWGLLLELALPNMNVYGILPPAREVQLLLERKRLSMLGISSYEIHPASGKIVFPLSTRLYQCHDYGYDVSVAPVALALNNY